MTSESKQLELAISLAVDYHTDQKDKLGMPYILHPLHVMDQMDTIEEKIVAVLHDVLEDTACSLNMLNAMFDDKIVEAVVAITKNKDEKYENYLLRVKTNPLALRVKLQDIKHNVSPYRFNYLPNKDKERLSKKYKFALEFLNA